MLVLGLHRIAVSLKCRWEMQRNYHSVPSKKTKRGDVYYVCSFSDAYSRMEELFTLLFGKKPRTVDSSALMLYNLQ